MKLTGFKISLLLIVFYGITPFIYINIYDYGKSELSDFTLFQLKYSIITVIFLYIINKIRFLNKRNLVSNNNRWLSINNASKIYPIIFVSCLISFFVNPWSQSREGLFASVSALFRILWILVTIPLLKTKKSKFLLLLSVILMFIDGSRTFVFVIFLYYLLNNYVNKIIIIVGFILVLLSASFRNGFYSFDLLYGIFGEGVNGSSGIFQVLMLPENISFPYITHLVFTLFQPFFVLLSLLVPSSLINFDSSQFISVNVSNFFAENYYPMGGFYILSEFIYYGYFGIFLFILYYFFSFRLTSLLLDNNFIKLSPVLLFMLIKSSPYTYWKWVIWFVIFQFILKKISIIIKYVKLA